MKKENWIWMPHAGHLIVGHQCQFKLSTYVGKYVVSTVGEYWPERIVREIHAEVYDPKWLEKNGHLRGDNFDSAYMKKFGFKDIGCERKFETTVFQAIKRKDKCCPYAIDVTEEVDMKGYNNVTDATKGHMKLCQKWSKK